MDIVINMMNGTKLPLRVHPEDTVGYLKQVLQGKLSDPTQMQRLVVDNGHKTYLSDDSLPLSYYGLQSGSTVSLLVTEPTTIQVFLRNEKGTVTTYDIKPDETVSDFKRKVQCRESVPESQQRLLHQSREMGAGKLSDYGVKSLSTIDLLMRLRGG